MTKHLAKYDCEQCSGTGVIHVVSDFMGRYSINLCDCDCVLYTQEEYDLVSGRNMF